MLFRSLTKDNHIILSNKIIDNIQNKTSLDLTEGFKKDIIDETVLQDKSFIKDQLFDNISTKLQIFKL